MKRILTTAPPALFAGLLLLVGCADSPSEPRAPRLGLVERSAGDGQEGVVGQPVETAPAVRLVDTRGEPMTGVAVAFAVTLGGGTVAQSQAVSDESGIATSGTWTLGTEGLNQLEARVGTRAPVRFTATARALYDIDVRYTAPVTARQRQAVTSAVARWESVITRDLPAVPVQSAAGSCFAGQPSLNEVVDDLVLYVSFEEIDGAGGTLGEAGPCLIRMETGLPLVGILRLDTSDLIRMQYSGTLDDVVLHEIGHVLGIGTIWSRNGLLSGAGSSDPRFIGAHGVATFGTLGGSAPTVPVENTGGSGTRDGHWRESEFGNELMTGYISGFPNPLSGLTIASLQDLGYGASAAQAASYELGGASRTLTSAPVDLRGREKLYKPKFKVDRRGRKEPIK